MIHFAHLHCPLRTHLVPARHGWYAFIEMPDGHHAEGWSPDCPWAAAAAAIAVARGRPT